MRKFLIATGIYKPDIGGPANYLSHLAPYISRNDELTVVAYSSVKDYADDKEDSWKTVRVSRSWPKIVRHLIYLFRVIREAREMDVLYSLSAINAGLAIWLASKLFHKKFVVRVVGDYAWERAFGSGQTKLLIDEFQKSKKSGFIALLDRVQKFVCRRASAIIVPSEYLASLVENWGVPRGRIQIVRNGVESMNIEVSKEDARRAVRVSGTVLLSFGRLVPWKGNRMLIKIMPELLRLNKFFQLVIIGSGPEFPVLANMIKNAGLHKQVFLYQSKPHDELALYFKAADIMVQNTGYEGMSHQVLEAMSAGLPVITTSVCGNPEIVTQGENGFLVDYNDEFNLIEAIKTLSQSPDMREKFIRQGIKTAERFSVSVMCENTLHVLEAQKITLS